MCLDVLNQLGLLGSQVAVMLLKIAIVLFQLSNLILLFLVLFFQGLSSLFHQQQRFFRVQLDEFIDALALETLLFGWFSRLGVSRGLTIIVGLLGGEGSN